MTKDELNICWRLNKKLGKLEEEYAAVEDSLLRITSKISALPKGGVNDDKTSHLVARKIDLAEKIQNLKDELLEKALELLNKILDCEELKVLEKQVLIYRYVHLQELLKYSKQHIYEKHKTALKKLCKEKSD